MLSFGFNFDLNRVFMNVSDSLLSQRWKRSQQPEEIYQRFPEFVSFLDRSKLLSQIKITRDRVEMIDDEPAIKVDGQFMKASILMKRFKMAESHEFHDQFVVDDTNNVYTYLDNGKGLQKYHPYLSVGDIPISRVDDGELRKIQTLARQFCRPGDPIDNVENNQNRSFVLQIVSSYTDRGRSRLSETLRNPRHAYIRIVAGADITDLNVQKGDVWEFGFFAGKNGCSLPMLSTQGRFRSPDQWEYTRCNQRFVTNIAISDEEAKKVFRYVLDYHRRNIQLGHELGFQLTEHNCSVFVREAAKQAGIHVPTEISLPALIDRIAPQVVRDLGNQICRWFKAGKQICRDCIHKYTMTCFSRLVFISCNKIAYIFRRGIEMFAAFVLTPIRVMLGGLNGQGGDAFDSRDDGKVSPPVWKLKNWFNLSSYSCQLPTMIQEWQKQQSSTVVFQDPIRLTVFAG